MSQYIQQPRLFKKCHEAFMAKLQENHPQTIAVLLRRQFPYLDKIEAERIAMYWLLTHSNHQQKDLQRRYQDTPRQSSPNLLSRTQK